MRRPASSEGHSLASLDSLSQKYNHIEIKKLPFCVWGHSCGGYWATNFTKIDPTRTIACFPSSGMDVVDLKPMQTTRARLGDRTAPFTLF